MKKTALILSGGGFKGSYQVGALNYIAENWTLITGKPGLMKFDVVAGVSVGALNGGMVAMDKLSELDELWSLVAKNGGKEIYESAILDNRGNFKPDEQKLSEMIPGLSFCRKAFLTACGSWLKGKGFKPALISVIAQKLKENLSGIRSLATNKALFKKLEEHFSIDYFPDDTQFICGFVSLTEGSYYSAGVQDFRSDEDLVNAVLASTSMPVVWEPVSAIHFKDQVLKDLADGGIRNVSPLGDVIEHISHDDEEAEYEFFIINCNNGRLQARGEEPLNIASIALRSLNDIAMAEIFSNDIDQFLMINDLVRQASPKELIVKGRKLRTFSFHLIQPSGFASGSSLNLEMENILGLKERGYADAASVFAAKFR